MTFTLYDMNEKDGLGVDVMRRVRMVYYLRFILNPLVIESAFFAAFAYFICISVSVPDIIDNISQVSLFSDEVRYVYDATLHTTVMVQVFLGVSSVLGLFIAYQLIRYVQPQRIFRRGRVQTV